MGFRHRAMKAEDVLVLSTASIMNVEREVCVWAGTRRSGRGYKSDVRGRCLPSARTGFGSQFSGTNHQKHSMAEITRTV